MSWEPINLASPEYDRDPEPPHADFLGLLYPGGRHVLSGPPESMKTIVAGLVALNAMRHGRPVAWVDFEMGPRPTRRLLADLGATARELAAVIYFEPDAPPDEQDIERLRSDRVELVVIDASVGAFHVSGLDEEKRKDVEWFARQWIMPLWQAGIATLVLDHVTKNAESRGKYAIGSERKVGHVQVHLGLEVVGNPLARGSTGVVKVRVHKDRGGYLTRPYATEIALTSDSETHLISVELRASTGAPSGTFQPTVLMGRVSDFLARQTEPVSQTEVETAVRGKGVVWVRQAVQALIEQGFVTEERGQRNARLLTLARPYATPSDGVTPEGDTTPSDPVQTPSDGIGVTPSTPSSPLQGDGDADGDVVTTSDAVDTPPPLPGDPDYLPRVYAAFEAGHVTEGEWKQATLADRLVRRAR